MSGMKTYLTVFGGIILCMLIIVLIGVVRAYGYIDNASALAIVAALVSVILAAIGFLRKAMNEIVTTVATQNEEIKAEVRAIKSTVQGMPRPSESPSKE